MKLSQFSRQNAASLLLGDSDFQARLKGDINNMRLIQDHVQHTAEIGQSATSIVRLLDSNVKRLDGVSDFEGQKLNKNHIYPAIGVLYGEDASSGKKAEVEFSPFLADVPAGLQNAIVEIEQNGRVLSRHRVADLMVQGNTFTIGGTPSGITSIIAAQDERYQAIDTNLLAADDNVQLTLTFPDGVSYTASASNYGYVKFVFPGFSTYAKK